MEKLKRYILFFIGLFINAFGVSLITKADLGTSPISSIPYVLSLHFPMTLGTFTVIFSLFLIALQLMILRKNFRLEHALQIPISFLFGWFIDLTMEMLYMIDPQAYPAKLLYLLAGCLILGFGVYTEVLADVAMLPGESFVRAVVTTWKTDFGVTKVCFDVSMTVIAGVLSVLFFHRLWGVREGTVIAALLVGFIARVFGRLLSFARPLLFPEASTSDDKGTQNGSAQPAPHVVIAIDRQFGSGGHDIGKAIAERLGWKFYDSELIQMAAGTTGYTPEFVRSREEKMTGSLLYDLVNQMYIYSSEHMAPTDQIFNAESNAIRELVGKENCVITGRCADYILRDDPACLRVFLQAPLSYRIRRIMSREGLTEEKARQKIRQTDQHRAEYYHYYTRRPWGSAPNYHLCLDTRMGEAFIQDTVIKAAHTLGQS